MPANTARELHKKANLAVGDALLRRFAAREHLPGLVAGIVEGGQLAHVLVKGEADIATKNPVTSSTVFRIASMTKNITALAILMLRDCGHVELDAPLVRYVPEAKALAATTDSRPVNLRDLLLHGAGFVTDDPWADRELGMTATAFSSLLNVGALSAQAPGLGFEYSNLGYALLGRVIRNVTGEPFQVFIHDELLKPLGLTHTTFNVASVPKAQLALGYRWANKKWLEEPLESDGEFGAMGGLCTTAYDYARYIAFLLQAWPARDGEELGPVRRATVRELAQVHSHPLPIITRSAGGKPYPIAAAYGYGLVSSIDGLLGRTLQHFGGLPGFGSHVLLSPDTGIGIFAFANRTYAPMHEACWQAAAALALSGQWSKCPIPIDARLARAGEAVRLAYNSGSIATAQDALAPNLLKDQPADERDQEIASLRRRFGQALSARVEARNALAGRVRLATARGVVFASFSLVPGPDLRIQMLKYERNVGT